VKLFLPGAWCYFHRTDFRNKQYAVPIREIAAHIQQSGNAANSAILVDSTNSNPRAMGMRDPPA
jgi:hypothetical protein